jgi:hypothetical protein
MLIPAISQPHIAGFILKIAVPKTPNSAIHWPVSAIEAF